MLRTPVCDLLQIEYPIVQGGMAWVADAGLAAAVSEGGGLGVIASMNAGADWLRQQIRKVQGETEKPFGVNIMLQSPFAAEAAQIVIEEKVPVVTTGAGSPKRYLPQWLEAGIKVLPVVPSAAIARSMERAGATAIIAEGAESGGHIGELTTMALIPQVRMPLTCRCWPPAASATGGASPPVSCWAPSACRWAPPSSSLGKPISTAAIRRRC